MSTHISQVLSNASNAAMPRSLATGNASNASKLSKTTVDREAARIAEKVHLDPTYEKFVCKALYWLGLPKVADIADRAVSPKVRNSARFFTSVCKRELAEL